MNKDREMILKMLKDGKVTVEEAEALLQVLEEAAEEEKSTSQAKRQPDEARGERKLHTDSAKHDEHEEGGGGQGFGFRFDQDFDFSFIGDTVKKSLSGLKDTIRSAMEGIKDVDIEAEIKRAFGKEKGHAETELEVSTEGATSLSVPSSSGETGDVSLYRSEDETLRVHGVVTSWGSDEEAAQRRAEAVSLSAVIDQGVITVTADTGEGDGIRRARVDYRIAVPSGISVRIDTVSGDITAEDVDGDCALSTISGDVEACRIGGNLRLRTKSGDLTVEGAQGIVSCGALSGDISIEDAFGPVECDSKSGDITVEDVHYSAKITSISGDLEVHMAKAATDAPLEIELRSISGDVELSTPADSGYHLEVKTTSGDIQCDALLAAERRSRTQLIGTVGDGSGNVQVATVSGDVEIS